MSYEVARWIREEGPFLTGLDLYRRLGGGPLLRTFERAAQRPLITPAVYNQLVEALQEHAPEAEPEPAATVAARPVEPDAILALRARGKRYKKRESQVHARMQTLANLPDAAAYETELYALAHEMMQEIQPELDRIYREQLPAWEKEGTLPVPGEERIVRDTVRKMKRLESLRTGSSALRKKLKQDLSPADRQQLQTELDDKLAEAVQLKQELGL